MSVQGLLRVESEHPQHRNLCEHEQDGARTFRAQLIAAYSDAPAHQDSLSATALVMDRRGPLARNPSVHVYSRCADVAKQNGSEKNRADLASDVPGSAKRS